MSSLFGNRDEDVRLDDLVAMATQGRGSEALESMDRKVAAIGERTGRRGAAYGSALFDKAQLELFLDLLPRAVETLRAAASLPSSTPDEEKSRLTYLMNLGDALRMAGRPEEALATHEESLRGREAFYGTEHPGYAFGLDSWAEAAMSLGRYEDASGALRRALANYQAAGHERFTRVLALLASEGAGRPVELQLGPEAAEVVLGVLEERRQSVPAALVLAAARRVLPFVVEAGRRAATFAAIQNAAMAEADHATAEQCLRELGAHAEASGDARLLVDVELGLGLCYERLGRTAQAAAAYASSEARARELADPPVLAKALRNAGLFSCHHEDAQRGARMLREAAAMRAAGDESARASVALGIHLQHTGAREEARAELRAALDRLHPSHPDAICAMSHFKALDSADGCGCGKPSEELYAQVARMIEERLPAGLVKEIRVTADDVQVHVTREITEAEGQQIAYVVELARAEMRQNIQRLYG